MLVAIDIAGGLEALGFTRPPEPVTSGHWGLLEKYDPRADMSEKAHQAS